MTWLRFHNEASICPACASSRITLLEAIPIPTTADGRRVTFVTGCHACGLVFANPLPTEEELRHYYSDAGHWAAAHAERTSKLEADHLRRSKRKKRPGKTVKPPRPRDILLDALDPYVPVHAPPPDAKVLDFGCGDGKFLNRLQDRGWTTYGIEPSTDVAFLRHNRLTSPPQDASFDFVFLNHVLEHVMDPLDLLRQLAGALRDGGILFVSVPRLDTLPEHRDFKYCLNGFRHVLAFSEACLTGLFARAGLATTARLDARELDDVFTAGQPLRLRLVATRTATPAAPVHAPLAPAVRALTRYARTQGGFGARLRGALPVRLRAALVEREREQSRRRKRAGG